MNVQGIIREIFEEQVISDSFKKREFIVEYAENPKYPEYLKFEMIQSNCDQLNDLNINDQVNVSFNLKGRKWTDNKGVDKYFNTLQAWRIELVGSTESEPNESGNPQWMKEDFSQDDDLPF